MTLHRLSGLRAALVAIRRLFLTKGMGMDLHPTVQLSLSAKPDLTFPKGVHVGAHSYLAFKDVPPRSVVAGNPAKIIQSDIDVGRYGRFVDADDTERALRKQDSAAGALPSGKLGQN